MSAISVEAIESINAELRRGGPLVGPQPAELRCQVLEVRTQGSTAVLCDSAWKAALPAALCVKAFKYLEYETQNLDMRSAAVRNRFYIQEPSEELHQTLGTHFPDEP